MEQNGRREVPCGRLRAQQRRLPARGRAAPRPRPGARARARAPRPHPRIWCVKNILYISLDIN